MLLSGAAGGAWLVGGGPLRGHAETAATVDADTAAVHGFAEPELEEIAVEETLAAGGVEKRVNVSGYITATGTGNGTQVLIATVPGWDVAGMVLNPLAYLPLKQAVNQVLPRLPFESPHVAWEDESTVALGEQSVTAGEYAVEGEGMRLVVARTTIEGDLVFAVAAYSSDSPDARERIEELFAVVSHG